MPDYRRTRSLQPGEVEPGPITSLYIPYLNDPTYTTPDKVAGPGLGGAGNETSTPQTALVPDDRLANIQALGDQRTQLENQLAANREAQDAGGSGLGGLWDGLKQVGSSIGNGLSALMPSGDTLRSGAMRLAQGLEAGGATMQGRTPLYIQLAQADRDFGLKQQEFNDKRMQLAQQLQQQKDQQRQNQWKQVFDVVGNPNLTEPQQMDLLKTMAKQGHPIANDFVGAINDKMLGDFKLVQHRLGMDPQEIMNKLQTGELNLHQLGAAVNVEKKNMLQEEEATAQDRAQQREIQALADQYETDPSKMTMTQKMKLKEYYAKHNKLDEELQALHLANKNSALNVQDKQLDLGMKQLMPQVSPEIPQPGGNTGKYVVDPATGQRQFTVGTKPPVFEKANDIEVAKAVGKDFAAIQDGGMKAQARLQKLDRMEQLVKGVKTGTLRPTLADTYNIAETFGIHLDPTLGKQQAFEALSNELALNARNTAEGGGMPGNMSNEDRRYLKNTVPGLQQSPEGNQELINIHRKLAKREVEIAKEARDYLRKNKGLDVGLYDHLQQYADSHPLFPQAKDSDQLGELSSEEFSLAQQLKKQGKTKDQIAKELQKRRGVK